MGWSDGYVVELPYTPGYYREMAPPHLGLCLLRHRLPMPRVRRYLELGCGQGVSLNIHAAASPASYVGVDFNPTHAAAANAMAEASGADVQVHDDSFAEFEQRLRSEPGARGFDVIAMHGVWSWVSAENRDTLLRILRLALRPGGVVYLSYNALPGWAGFMPLRELMVEHAACRGGPSGGVAAAIGATRTLFEAAPDVLRQQGGLAQRMQGLGEHNPSYLTHEYFNADWAPMSVIDLLRHASEAKLEFACSATLLEHASVLNIPAPLRAALAELPTQRLQLAALSWAMQQTFRRDLLLRGSAPLGAAEQAGRLRQTHIALQIEASAVPMTVRLAFGDAELKPEIYLPILEAMDRRNGWASLGELEADLATANLPLAIIADAASILIGAGHAASAQSPEVAGACGAACRRLNRHLLDRAALGGDQGHLASPVLGGGTPVSITDQMFLAAHHAGRRGPADMAAFAAQQLDLQGRQLVMEGKAQDDPATRLGSLRTSAQQFVAQRLRVLERLQVAV